LVAAVCDVELYTQGHAEFQCPSVHLLHQDAHKVTQWQAAA